jgi:hypothetical protein
MSGEKASNNPGLHPIKGQQLDLCSQARAHISDITELLSFQEKHFIHKYRDNKCEQLIRTEQLVL